MRLQVESARFRQERGKKSNYVRRQRMPVRFRLQQGLQISEIILDASIQRPQVNCLTGQSFNSAAGSNIYRKIQGHSPAVEKIEGPQVDGSSRQISPAGCGSQDRSFGRTAWSPRIRFGCSLGWHLYVFIMPGNHPKIAGQILAGTP